MIKKNKVKINLRVYLLDKRFLKGEISLLYVEYPIKYKFCHILSLSGSINENIRYSVIIHEQVVRFFQRQFRYQNRD